MFIPSLYLKNRLSSIKEAKTDDDLNSVLYEWLDNPHRLAMATIHRNTFMSAWRARAREHQVEQHSPY